METLISLIKQFNLYYNLEDPLTIEIVQNIEDYILVYDDEEYFDLTEELYGTIALFNSKECLFIPTDNKEELENYILFYIYPKKKLLPENFLIDVKRNLAVTIWKYS